MWEEGVAAAAKGHKMRNTDFFVDSNSTFYGNHLLLSQRAAASVCVYDSLNMKESYSASFQETYGKHTQTHT